MAAEQTRQRRRRPTSPAAARTAVGRGLRGRGADAAEGEEPDVEAGRRGLPVLLRCAQDQGRRD